MIIVIAYFYLFVPFEGRIEKRNQTSAEIAEHCGQEDF